MLVHPVPDLYVFCGAFEACGERVWETQSVDMCCDLTGLGATVHSAKFLSHYPSQGQSLLITWQRLDTGCRSQVGRCTKSETNVFCFVFLRDHTHMHTYQCGCLRGVEGYLKLEEGGKGRVRKHKT